MTSRFAIDQWAAWAPGLTDPEHWRRWLDEPIALERDETPALTQMPALMRRRVERLGRMALEVAYTVTRDAPSGPIVFASRYGDVERSLGLLRQLAAGETPSPAGFSLSVHNAVGALFSIARQDPTTYTAVAAGDETVEAAFMEAIAMLADGSPSVTVVYYEEPLPALYAPFGDPRDIPRGWACRLSLAGHDGLSLQCGAGSTPDAARRLPSDLATLRFLISNAARHSHCTGGRTWLWQRHV